MRLSDLQEHITHLYLNRQNVKNYIWLVALLPLLSGCESQAILVKKTTHTLRHQPPKRRLRQTAAGGVFETGYNWSLTADRRATAWAIS